MRVEHLGRVRVRVGARVRVGVRARVGVGVRGMVRATGGGIFSPPTYLNHVTHRTN